MDTAETAPLPLWKRIVNFPLITMLIALALIAAVIVPVNLAANALSKPLGWDLVEPMATVTVIAALIVLQKTVLRHLGARKHDDLPFAAAPRNLAAGALGASALFTLVVGIAALLGAYVIDGWGGMKSWVFILFWAGFNAGFVEELMFRGVMFRWIEEFGGSWAALIVTSGLFGLVHMGNANATWMSGLTIAAVAGTLLGGAYMLTRSLWLPVGLHFGWNVTQGLVWDVPVSGYDGDGLVDARLVGDPLISGGAFGLEASVIALVVGGAAGAWMVRRAVRAGQVMQPWWVRRRLASQA
ncbi:MAG: CPBP family intramembrane metalloprotease [Porphyrobacter sp.]|nr:CPBP family intramembrane metalloprotease [Porphyrobacter sp.]